MKKRLLIAIAGLISLVPAYGSSIVLRPRADGDNTVRPDGTAGAQFVDDDDWVLVQPVRQRDLPLSPLNARRGMIEFDVFGSLGNPFLEQSSNWQPGDTIITRAILKLHLDSDASTRGIGVYDIYGYRARNQLLPQDSADEPNRVPVGQFETRVNINEYVTIEIDVAWLQQIWNQDINRLRPGFQIRATDGAPNRLGIDAFNYDCACFNFEESPLLELTFASPVPEPATVGLTGLGLVSGGVLARRRRRPLA